MKKIAVLYSVILFVTTLALSASQIAYIYGNVASNGAIPSGTQAPYHQMLLTDSGDRGCSDFNSMIESEGHSIHSYYDQTTTLNAAFLEPLDVIIFGLHQKVWSATETAALDSWIRNGGGILMYSDSAAGGLYSSVGIKNTTGQTAVNSILSRYGMQVAVDQAGGVRAYRPLEGNPVVSELLEFEAEGISPVAVDVSAGVQILIPFDDDYKLSGSSLSVDAQNITIANPVWAAMALQQVGEGNVIGMFDRQPVWNNGEGSDIHQRDNLAVLRSVVNYLAQEEGPVTGAPIGKLIWLKANANGMYVCADQKLGSEVPLAANRTAPGSWETFTVFDAGDGLVGLKANSNGKYVCADLMLGTTVPLAANRPGIGAWEKFTWIENSDGTISLKANSNGKYICADKQLGTSVPVVANRPEIGAWEKFTWGE